MRVCQLEDSISTHFEDLSRRGSTAQVNYVQGRWVTCGYGSLCSCTDPFPVPCQVGLLVGRLGVGSRDFILLLTPSPSLEVWYYAIFNT